MSQDDDKPEGQDERTVELSGVELHALRQSATNLLRVTREDVDALDDSEPEITEVREDDVTPLPASIIPAGLGAMSEAESDAVDSTRTFDRGSLKDLIKEEVKKSTGGEGTATAGILRRGPIRDPKKEALDNGQVASTSEQPLDKSKHTPRRDDPPTVEVDLDYDSEIDLDADLAPPAPEIIEEKEPEVAPEVPALEEPRVDVGEESEELEVADAPAASTQGEAIDTPALESPATPPLEEEAPPSHKPEVSREAPSTPSDFAKGPEPADTTDPGASFDEVAVASRADEPLVRESSSGKLVGVLVIMLGVILLIAGGVVAALLPVYMIAGLSLTGVGALAAAIGLFLLTR